MDQESLGSLELKDFFIEYYLYSFCLDRIDCYIVKYEMTVFLELNL